MSCASLSEAHSIRTALVQTRSALPDLVLILQLSAIRHRRFPHASATRCLVRRANRAHETGTQPIGDIPIIQRCANAEVVKV